MTVLVTGGAGFVGSYVVRELLARDEQVVIYDVAPERNALDLVLGGNGARGLSIERGEIADGWRLLDVVRGHRVDRIVHLASPLTTDVAAHPPLGVESICGATAGVFEVARALGVRRVVWASSVAVFGRRASYPEGPLANDAPHLPENLYGACKSLCERLALSYRDDHGVDSIGLRLTVVYGPGRLRGYMSFASELLRRAALGEDVVMPIADVPMSWQYVEEVAATVVHCLAAPPTEHVAFNTHGDVRTFREAADLLRERLPHLRIDVRTEPADAGQHMLSEAVFDYDASELERQTGYEPRFPLEAGIDRSLASYRRLHGAGTPVR